MKEIIKKKMSCRREKNADAYDKKVLLQITHAILNRMRYEILKYIRWEMSLCQLRWEKNGWWKEKDDYEDNILDVCCGWG